jgi:glycosyltransferase involved in cell wall biosynthesis
VRVLVVCDWFLKYAVEQTIGLRQAGADAALLCRDHAGEFGGDAGERKEFVDRAARHGVEVIELRGRTSSIRHLPDVARVGRAVRSWRPDVVHVHDQADPRCLLIGLRSPVVLTVHDPVRHPGQPGLEGIARTASALAWRVWLRRARILIVHGEDLRREMVALHGGARVESVPFGQRPAPVPLPPPERLAVVFFGRLEPYKGLRTLLSAMERVWGQRPDIELVVAGAGSDAGVVRGHPRVRLMEGYVPESRIDELLGQASLVVLPYTQASQSAVGSLAMERGVPVIVSDAGSLPDLALDRSFVTPAGDVAALAGAILRHVDHGAQTRDAVLARSRALFSWQIVGEQSVALYRSLLSPQAPRP